MKSSQAGPDQTSLRQSASSFSSHSGSHNKVNVHLHPEFPSLSSLIIRRYLLLELVVKRYARGGYYCYRTPQSYLFLPTFTTAATTAFFPTSPSELPIQSLHNIWHQFIHTPQKLLLHIQAAPFSQTNSLLFFSSATYSLAPATCLFVRFRRIPYHSAFVHQLPQHNSSFPPTTIASATSSLFLSVSPM